MPGNFLGQRSAKAWTASLDQSEKKKKKEPVGSQQLDFCLICLSYLSRRAHLGGCQKRQCATQAVAREDQFPIIGHCMEETWTQHEVYKDVLVIFVGSWCTIFGSPFLDYFFWLIFWGFSFGVQTSKSATCLFLGPQKIPYWGSRTMEIMATLHNWI